MKITDAMRPFRPVLPVPPASVIPSGGAADIMGSHADTTQTQATSD